MDLLSAQLLRHDLVALTAPSVPEGTDKLRLVGEQHDTF